MIQEEAGKFLPFLVPIITARATRMSIPIRNSPSTGERKIEREVHESPLGRSNNRERDFGHARFIAAMHSCDVTGTTTRTSGARPLVFDACRVAYKDAWLKIPYEPSPSVARAQLSAVSSCEKENCGIGGGGTRSGGEVVNRFRSLERK